MRRLCLRQQFYRSAADVTSPRMQGGCVKTSSLRAGLGRTVPVGIMYA